MLHIHTHCQVAQSQPHESKLVKEYVCPNAKNEMNKIKTAYNSMYSA